MKRSLLALALLVSAPTYANETLVMVLVDGKAISAEPILLDPAHVSFAPSQWQAVGVMVPKALRNKPTVSTKDLAINAVYDESTLEIRISVPARLRATQTLGYVRPQAETVSPSPKGVMLDYDIAVSLQGKDKRASVGHVARVPLAGGTLTTTGQANWINGHGQYIRGTTTYRKDFPAKGTSLQVGDVSPANNGLNNPAILGGVRIGTDRGLTRHGAGNDIPLIGGLADTRSTAEVFVNEHQRATGQINPGPYELAPTIAMPGLNNVEVVQRDAFGREQTYSRSFYSHPDLLRKGRTEWDITAGAVRTDPLKDMYKGLAYQGALRYGLTDTWTMGATVQGGAVNGKGGRNATLHNTVSLGNAGLLQADVSTSQTTEGVKGSAVRVGYERHSENWSIQASHQRKSKDYWEISDLQDRPFKITSQTTAALSYHPQGKDWNGTLSYSAIDYDNNRSIKQLAVQGTVRKSRSTWMAGLTHDLASGDTGAYAGVRFDLGGPQVSATVKAAPNIGVSADTTYSDTTELAGRDVRWQVGATLGDYSQAYGRIDTTVAGGDLSLEARKRKDSSLLLNGRYRNSVWIGEGGVMNGNGYNANGSFAVVEVPDQVGVAISGNRPTPSRTNKHGYALLTGLAGLSPVNVTLDSETLPENVEIEDTDQQVVAPRQGGGKIAFNTKVSTTQQWVVRLGEGFAPSGAKATSNTGEQFLLAERGVLVFEKPATTATLELPGKICELALPKQGGDVFCH